MVYKHAISTVVPARAVNTMVSHSNGQGDEDDAE
jgi:host factor-I protein